MADNFLLSPEKAPNPNKKHFIKVVVIGNSAVGKTSLI